MAQYQDGLLIAHRQLNLGDATHYAKRSQKITQGRKQSRHLRGDHLAAVHIHDKAAVTPSEANKHAPFLGHITGRKPRLHTIAPVRTVNGRQHLIVLYLGDMLQHILKRTLLDSDLRSGVQMLHRTAPTGPEILAGWLDTQSRRLQDLNCPGAVVIFPAADGFYTYPLSWQCAFYKDHLAFLIVSHSLPGKVKRLNQQLLCVHKQ